MVKLHESIDYLHRFFAKRRASDIFNKSKQQKLLKSNKENFKNKRFLMIASDFGSGLIHFTHKIIEKMYRIMFVMRDIITEGESIINKA